MKEHKWAVHDAASRVQRHGHQLAPTDFAALQSRMTRLHLIPVQCLSMLTHLNDQGQILDNYCFDTRTPAPPVLSVLVDGLIASSSWSPSPYMALARH